LTGYRSICRDNDRTSMPAGAECALLRAPECGLGQPYSAAAITAADGRRLRL
jgi:hypothetical protein